MQVSQATLPENLTLANVDSSAGFAKGLRVTGRGSSSQCTHQGCKVSAPAPCFPLHREQHAQMPVVYLCPAAAHKHTDMQASSTSSEAVLGLQHTALSHTPDSYCSQKTTGPSQQPCSHRSTEMETCFPNCSPNSKHVSSHKPGYEQGHSFRPLKFPLLPNKSCICVVSPLQPNLHLCLPAPLVPGYSLPTRSADAQHFQHLCCQTNAEVLAMDGETEIHLTTSAQEWSGRQHLFVL